MLVKHSTQTVKQVLSVKQLDTFNYYLLTNRDNSNDSTVSKMNHEIREQAV